MHLHVSVDVDLEDVLLPPAQVVAQGVGVSDHDLGGGPLVDVF